MRRQRQSGFTLMEVMVAFAIAALGFAGVAVAMSQHTDNAIKLRDRTLALFISSNAITELRLGTEFPKVGRTTEEIEYAARDWIVETVVEESGVDGLRRLLVSVSFAEQPDQRIRTTMGFISNGARIPANARPRFSQLDRGVPANDGDNGQDNEDRDNSGDPDFDFNNRTSEASR